MIVSSPCLGGDVNNRHLFLTIGEYIMSNTEHLRQQLRPQVMDALCKLTDKRNPVNVPMKLALEIVARELTARSGYEFNRSMILQIIE